jgi:hypothetical protein
MAATALMRQLVTAGSQGQLSSGSRQDHTGVTASASYRLRDRDQSSSGISKSRRLSNVCGCAWCHGALQLFKPRTDRA